MDDLCEEFARDFIFPMMQAAALMRDSISLAQALRALSSLDAWSKSRRKRERRQWLMERPGKGNDQVRFELTVAAPRRGSR